MNFSRYYSAYLSAEAMKGERLINVLRLCVIVLLAVTEIAERSAARGMPPEVAGTVHLAGALWFVFGALMLWTVNYRRILRPWFKYAVPLADALFFSFAALSLRDDVAPGSNAFFFFLIGVSLFRYNRRAVWAATAASACAYLLADYMAGLWGLPVCTAPQLWIHVGVMLLFGFLSSFSIGTALDRTSVLIKDRVYREQLENAVSKLVPYHVASEIFAANADLDVAGRGHSACVAVLFADIRGFTKLAQKLAPAELMDKLNAHFYELGDIVFMHGGNINKFVGDAAIAVFGDPLKLENPCYSAVRCANEIVKAVAAANAAGREPAFEVGIGIHYGELVAGNLGSEDRIEYAVIGDTVNMTERIQSCAKAGEVLVSGAVVEQAGPAFEWVQSENEFTLKGYSSPVKLFLLAGTAETVF